jgi:hypothetical protein
MKLREVLSFIFIEVYGQSFYSLLQEVDVKIATKEVPNEAYYKKHLENEFFFLLFSDYIKLNERKPVKNGILLDLIKQSIDFDSLKNKLTSSPISNEKYHDFLASIKERLDAIDKLRNCVAHNRSIPEDIRGNYNMSKELLLKSISEFWDELNHEDDRPFWEEDAYRAVQKAMESANWNFEDGTVEIKMDDCGRSQTCNSYEELFAALEEIANKVASANMPFEEGEPIFSYDPYSAAESVLQDYQEKLKELGWEV